MKAVIVVNMDNAAFEDDPGELPRILHNLADSIADRVDMYPPKVGDGCPLSDYNGNRVGAYAVED